MPKKKKAKKEKRSLKLSLEQDKKVRVCHGGILTDDKEKAKLPSSSGTIFKGRANTKEKPGHLERR